MLSHFYANYGGYFWAAIIAIVTYAIMTVLKKSFLPISKKLCTTEKSRRITNLALGIIFSVAVAIVLGKTGNFLFGTVVPTKWFVLGGFIANYAYLIYEKYKESNLVAFAKAFEAAVKESNLEIDIEDLPAMTDKIKDVVSKFAVSTDNKHAVLVNKVASAVADSVEISPEEEKEIVDAVEKLKSAGYDVGGLEKTIAEARADGKITADEKAIIMAAVETIRKAIVG